MYGVPQDTTTFFEDFCPDLLDIRKLVMKPNLEIEEKLKIKLGTHLSPELKVNVDSRVKVAAKWNRKGGTSRFDICWKQAGPVNWLIDFSLNIGIHSTQRWKMMFWFMFLPQQRPMCSDILSTELLATARAEFLVGEARTHVDVTLVNQYWHLLLG